MFTVFDTLPKLGMLAAFASAAALAGVWFAVVVAKPYARSLGRVGNTATPQTPVMMFGPIVCVAVTTVTSAVLIEALHITMTGDAIVFGLIVGIGYLSAMAFQIGINPNIPRPLLYGAVNAPYFIVSSVVVSVILTALR